MTKKVKFKSTICGDKVQRIERDFECQKYSIFNCLNCVNVLFDTRLFILKRVLNRVGERSILEFLINLRLGLLKGKF